MSGVSGLAASPLAVFGEYKTANFQKRLIHAKVALTRH